MLVVISTSTPLWNVDNDGYTSHCDQIRYTWSTGTAVLFTVQKRNIEHW